MGPVSNGPVLSVRKGPNNLRQNGGFQNRRLPFLGKIWDLGPPVMLDFMKTKTEHYGGHKSTEIRRMD